VHIYLPLKTWIKTQKCSIAFLQETHLDENIENEIKNKTNFAIYCSNGTSASRGVGIVINKSLNYEIMDKFTDEDGRMILINIKIENTVFSMVSYDWPVFYPSVVLLFILIKFSPNIC
jgi:exonuclease III